MRKHTAWPLACLGFVLLSSSCSKKSSDSADPAVPITDPTINAADYQRCPDQAVSAQLQADLNKTIQTPSIAVIATAKLSADVSSSTGMILFDISSSDIVVIPEYARGTVVDTLNGTTGTIGLVKATDAAIEASGYLDITGDIDCSVLFVSQQVSKKDDGVQKLITYDPPLPFGILPQADATAVDAFFTAKSEFSGIATQVTQAYGGTIAAGSKATGKVTVSGSGLDRTFTNTYATSAEYDIAGLAKSDRFKVVNGAYTEVDLNYEILFPGSSTPETLSILFR